MTWSLLDYPDFENQQRKLVADQKVIQQINFAGDLEDSATIFFIIKKAKDIF